MHFIDAIPTHKDLDWPVTVVAHKPADPSGRAVARDRFIIERQKVVPRLDAGGGSRRCLGDRQDGRLSPTYRQSLAGKRTVFARQAADSTRVQTDLCPCPIFAVVAVGDADAESDIVETANLGEIVAELIDLLFTPFGFDLFGRQRRQF